MTARDVATRVLDRIDRDKAWATPTLDGELARSGLAERDRRLAAELVYGVLRRRSRIDRALATHADLERTPARVMNILRVAVYQLLYLDRVPDYAVVDAAVEASSAIGGSKLAGFANAMLRKLVSAGEAPFAELAPDASLGELLSRLELEHSLPRWILDELAAALGGGKGSAADRRQLSTIAEAFSEPAPIVARTNARRTSRDALVAELAASGVVATPIDAAPDLPTPMALRLEGVGDPARNDAFVAGRWTVQDPGAQAVALAAAPRADLRILDACAGVGGKSTYLAELVDDRGTIDAADVSGTKLGLLDETARRLGLTCIRPTSCDLLDPTAPLASAYDLVVLDAPCSGLGVLRRHPDAKWRVTRPDVPRLAALQRQLLDAVVPRVAPGGTLVYSVCTFTRAEGAEQIAALVSRFPDLRVVAEHRTWPPDADAFYLARLERSS